MTNKDKQLIRLYGEFLTRFEFVCSRLLFAISHLLFPDDYISKRNVCEIMTEGLTADPLLKKFLALIIERNTKQSDIYKSSNLISKTFKEIIELRNSFAHGTPFFGEHDFIQETKKARLVLQHPKLKSEGLDLNFKSYDSKKLNELISCLHKIESSIHLVTVQLRKDELKVEVKKIFNDKILSDLKALNIKQLMK